MVMQTNSSILVNSSRGIFIKLGIVAMHPFILIVNSVHLRFVSLHTKLKLFD